MSLQSHEIERKEWEPFMARFSRVHRGWRVSVGVIDTEIMRRSMEAEAHTVSEDALFEDLRLDQRAEGDRLALVLGLQTAFATHAVPEPRRLFVETTEKGEEEALRVDSADGTSLLLRFRAAATPEDLDGLAPSERQ